MVKAATTYYVDNSITDTNASSAIPDCVNYDPVTFTCGGGTASVYKTIADVNLKSFSPGDLILFRRGQTWREQLNIKNSGLPDSQITYSDYGEGVKPRITAADIISEMSLTTTPNVYSKTGIITTPTVIIIDGIMGIKKPSLGELASNNDWHFSSNTLYVYSTSNIASKTVEAGIRDKVVNTTSTGKSYFTLKNLQLDSANHSAAGAGVYISGVGATGVVVDNCDIKYNLYGILFFTTNAQAGGHIVSNSLIYNNRSSGIHLNAGSDGSTEPNRTHIYNNQIYNNAGFGILAYTSYWLIEHNNIYNNGDYLTPAGWSGIHVWGGPKGSPTANAGDNNIIRYNRISGTLSLGEDGSGIGIDMYADNNQIYQNIAYDNDGPGISLASNSGNKIFNNTTYGNNLNTSGELTKLGEIRVTGQKIGEAANFSIKNNIAYATAPYAYAIFVDAYSYNNNPDITNNIWHAPNATSWFLWKFHNPPVGTIWNNLPGVGTDLNVDPLFVDPDALDFRLQASSPAIDHGVNVGLITDLAGTALPQDTGFDIGAYEYAGTIDITPPTVEINYTFVSKNIIKISASASDNLGIASIQLKLDNINLGFPLVNPPYTYLWGITTVQKGWHTLSAVAVDLAGNTSTASKKIRIK